jgi:hypothetical protein
LHNAIASQSRPYLSTPNGKPDDTGKSASRQTPEAGGGVPQ